MTSKENNKKEKLIVVYKDDTKIQCNTTEEEIRKHREKMKEKDYVPAKERMAIFFKELEEKKKNNK